MRSTGRRGFTLIELLVVIAIIALLAAILFPVFARARENARRSSCQSNLKQLALGFHQYAQDFDEQFPLRYYPVTCSPFTYKGWVDNVQPYLKSTQIFQCPSETTAPGTDPTLAGYTDYIYSNEVGDGATLTNSCGAGYPAGLILSKFSVVSLTVVNFEGPSGVASAGNSGSDFILGYQPDPSVSPVAARAQAARRHLDGSNFTFADGHVKWYRPEQVTNGATSVGKPTFQVS